MVDFATLGAQIEMLAETNPNLFYTIILITLFWKLIWYGLAIWRTIERKQQIWFVALFIASFMFSDLGILAIIYLLIYREKNQEARKRGRKK